MQYLTKTLLTVWDWLVYSSANQQKVSLTVQGFIPFVVALFATFNIKTDVEGLNELVNLSLQVIAGIVTAVTGLVSTYGLFRKTVNTAKNLGLVKKETFSGWLV